jgi:ubiquinone/menaquinone biosynthesis C-methylase UbiE
MEAIGEWELPTAADCEIVLSSGSDAPKAFAGRLLAMSPLGFRTMLTRAATVPPIGERVTANVRLGATRFELSGVVTEQTGRDEDTECLVAYERVQRPVPSRDQRIGTRWKLSSPVPVIGAFANPLAFDDQAYFTIEDISLGGVRVQTSLRNKFIAPGQRLAARITFPFVGELDTVLLVKTVDIRVKPETAARLVVSAEFADVSDRHLDVISAYLAEFCSGTDLETLATEGLMPSSFERMLRFVQVDDAVASQSRRGARHRRGIDLEGILLTEPVLRLRLDVEDREMLQAELLWANASYMSDEIAAQLVSYLVLCAFASQRALLALDAGRFSDLLVAQGFRRNSRDQLQIDVPAAIAGRGVSPLVWAKHWRAILQQVRAAGYRTGRPRLLYRALLPVSRLAVRMQEMIRPRSVAWDHYALHYDQMCAANPAYQENVRLIEGWARTLDLGEVRTVYELGAGTGNITLALARQLPDARIVHVDQDAAMNLVARRRYTADRIANIEIQTARIEELSIEPASIDLVVCAHSLYTLQNPVETLDTIRAWLRPGGHLLIIDVGRTIKLANWGTYLFWHSTQRSGLARTVHLLFENLQVARQNRNIAAKQAAGEYWTHDLGSFTQTLRDRGFDVLTSGVCYRGISDYAVCRRSPNEETSGSGRIRVHLPTREPPDEPRTTPTRADR